MYLKVWWDTFGELDNYLVLEYSTATCLDPGYHLKTINANIKIGMIRIKWHQYRSRSSIIKNLNWQLLYIQSLLCQIFCNNCKYTHHASRLAIGPTKSTCPEVWSNNTKIWSPMILKLHPFMWKYIGFHIYLEVLKNIN